MPTTATAALIIVLAILPGLLGDRIYRSLIGRDWRETEWKGILQLIAFSTAGAIIYGLASALLAWPSPIHLIPTTYDKIQQGTVEIDAIFLPYAGHAAGGAIAGILAVSGAMLLARFSPRSPFPTAWDDFIRTYIVERWVIVGLQNGDVYAGRLVNADLSVPTAERDVVLAEPCLFDSSKGIYVALSYQHIFLQAANIYSIASVYEKEKDRNRRLAPVGEPLFVEVNQDAKRETALTATSETTGGRGETRLEASTTNNEATRGGAATATNTEKEVSNDDPSLPLADLPKRARSRIRQAQKKQES